MHLLLTDRLACPRCGPRFGLVLLAERMRERRVLEGVLGCPNCRDAFPVRDGFGDLRPPPRTALPEPGPPEPDTDTGEAMRLAALLGITEGPGHALVVGPASVHAAGIASLVDGLELVAVGADLRRDEEREGVSRLVAGPDLPFFDASLRGAVLSGDEVERYFHEAVRAVGPPGRIVVTGAGPADLRRVEAAGLEVLLHEGDVLVAAREPREGGRASAGMALPVFPGPGPRNP